MSRVDDQWCDWCALPIEPGCIRRRDDRVFCSPACVVAYCRGGDSPVVREFRPRE